MNVYAIRDQVAEYFMQPFYARNNGEAQRSFTGAVNDASNPNNLMAASPSNFALYHIGTYDEQTGQISGLELITLLGIGTDFIVTKN